MGDESRGVLINTTRGRSQSDIQGAAMSFMDLGWPVFAVNGKVPCTRHGVKDASTEHRLAALWFERYPERGVALATGRPSGVWVLDLDGQDGIDAFNEPRPSTGTWSPRSRRRRRVAFTCTSLCLPTATYAIRRRRWPRAWTCAVRAGTSSCPRARTLMAGCTPGLTDGHRTRRSPELRPSTLLIETF